MIATKMLTFSSLFESYKFFDHGSLPLVLTYFSLTVLPLEKFLLK